MQNYYFLIFQIFFCRFRVVVQVQKNQSWIHLLIQKRNENEMNWHLHFLQDFRPRYVLKNFIIIIEF